MTPDELYQTKSPAGGTRQGQDDTRKDVDDESTSRTRASQHRYARSPRFRGLREEVRGE